MAFKFSFATKKDVGKLNAQIPLGKKKKPLLDDGEDATQAKPKAAGQAQEIVELSFQDTLASALGLSQSATPKGRKWATPSEPPTKKPTPKADDPSSIGHSASAAEAEARAREAAEVDATIYDYDAAYDALHAKTAAKAAAERQNSNARKPKYLDTLLASAKQREKDLLRARDKLLQRERDAEGDDFVDKEKFVTGAYKAQQEEARQAEFEEEARQALEEEQKKKYGMQGFHKSILMEQEKRHQDAIEAAAMALKDGPPQPAQLEEPREREKTEAELVEELRKQGKTVIINEDGQVADKRQLLSAGLNVIVPPSKSTANSKMFTSSQQHTQTVHGKDASVRSAQRQRHTQIVAQQIQTANKRKADEEELEQAKLLHAAKSQKTATDIMSAKERYLQRKKEAAAAAAAAVGKEEPRK